VVESLPSSHEALSAIPRTAKNEKEKGGRNERNKNEMNHQFYLHCLILFVQVTCHSESSLTTQTRR
jgi:hypothetical protein